MQANEREFATLNHDRQTFLLRNVEAALRRIESAEYGICTECGEEIHPKRLEAVPWTPYCLKCQEAADRREADSLRSFRSMLNVA